MIMVIIPEKFSENLEKIIEWNRRVYMFDKMDSILLNRILEHFYKRNMVDGFAE